MKSMFWIGCCVLTGCGGDAGVELAASETLHVLADRMTVAITEYHDEVEASDDVREAAVASAFVTRVVNDHADRQALDRHTAAFIEALRRVRQDRRTEDRRRNASMDNVEMMREVADGLREMAIRSMALKDEMRGYLRSWAALKRQADEAMEHTGDQP
jgi:hypothetical protein